MGLFHTKDKAPNHIKELQACWKAQGKQPITFIFSDKDSVFISNNFQSWMRDKGIVYYLTVCNMPQQNGLAEVTQFHLHQRVTAMLSDQNLPQFL